MKTSVKNGSNPVKSFKPEDILDDLAKSSSYFRKMAKNVDLSMIRRIRKLTELLTKILSTASPRSTNDLISGIAVDLADFWEIAEEHRRRIKELSKMHFPKDKKRFVDMIYEFEIRLVIHAEWHTKRLKRELVRLKRDLKLI